jgi:hypothetical protein
MAQQHPIFDDIRNESLEEVKRRVLADLAVLEERGVWEMTPLIYAVWKEKPAIALWVIEHRGQHDLEIQYVYHSRLLSTMPAGRAPSRSCRRS